MSRKMKDSGIEWIGQIPEEWEVAKNKYLLNDMYSGGTPTSSNESFYCEDGIPFVSISDMSSCQYVIDTKKRVSESGIKDKNLKILDIGTILYSIYATIGAVSELKIPATISQAMLALTLKDCIVKSYYKYNLHAMRDYIFFNSNGNTQFNLNAEKVWNFSFVLPPLPEQQKIADFLDRKCAEIDSVIKNTEATIEEYKKLKQSVITEAVTKGIRGDRPMKDSGIEWIGEIPEEWEVSRVGLHYDIILGKMLCASQVNEDYTLEKYFCALNVHFDGISSTDELKTMWFSSAEKQIYKVAKGDLLVVEGGAGAGGCAIVENVEDDVFIQNSIMIVRSKEHKENRYLRYLIESLVKLGYVDFVCNKATIPHFTKEKLATVPYPVISITEQQEIADYLDSKCSEIDKLITAKQQLLEELATYKKSVIYEYVTGKKEVS